ncbi:MAG: twin-arginine translocation signal domain-containing protein [Pseudomonadota bacterium]
MAKNREEKIAEDRRDFLKMASLGTVAGGAVIATAGTVQAELLEEDKGSGYRETGHVKTYYELAKF